MIQEYYLHMFCGTNGEHDHTTGAGRLAIAALMSGFGLTASTKKDLQTRVGWTVTPGCFLGQKELKLNDYYLRNYPETQLACSLLVLRKVNRTMNYQLDWSVLDTDWDTRVTGMMWINLAKIYWLGYFLFGRNVLPEFVLTKLREKFNPAVHEQGNQRQSLKCHYVMQFMKNIGLPLESVREHHLFTGRTEDLDRTDIFVTFAMGWNWNENTAGFYAVGSMIGTLVREGQTLGDISAQLAPYSEGRPGRFSGNYMPFSQQYYYTYGLGRPTLPSTPSRMPQAGRDIVPLFFADLTITPQQEQSAGYTQRRGRGFNTVYLTYNIHAWMTAALLWEYHLMLTGRELFPLASLRQARETKAWSEEYLMGSIMHLNPTNSKNCSVAQLIRFNLERQSQV